MALGKTFFWSDGSGLLVRATKQDLDVIETALEALIRPLPQINIKVRFVEIERGDPRATGWDWFRGNDLLAKGSGTNSSSHCYILTDPQFRVVLRAFEQRKGADTLAGPEISTVSGRQAQVQVVEMKTVLTGINPQALLPPGIISTTGTSNALYQTQAMSFGPVLDVIPALAADGNTISLTITPTVTEFLGYDDPTTNTAVYINGKKETVAVPLPRFRVRQMNLSAAVQDGQTLVLLNPATTEIFKKPDGGTETKDVSSTQTNQLIVFLTATLVDAAGNRLHAAEESAPKPK
jgi:type II secretory pathway component GspD/PulD (secretin)